MRADAPRTPWTSTVHAGDRAVGEDGPVSGDSRDAEARAELVADVVGKVDGLVGGNDGSCAAVPNAR